MAAFVDENTMANLKDSLDQQRLPPLYNESTAPIIQSLTIDKINEKNTIQIVFKKTSKQTRKGGFKRRNKNKTNKTSQVVAKKCRIF